MSVAVDEVVVGLSTVNLKGFDIEDGELEEITKRIYTHEGRKDGDTYVISH